MRPRAVFAPLLALAWSCSPSCGSPARPVDAASDRSDDVDAAAEGELASPRCRDEPGALRLAPDDATVEVGTAVAAGASVHLGLVRGGEAAVAVVAADLASVRVLDLGRADPEGPPPVPAADGADAFVAWTRRGDAGRRVVIARLGERAEVVWDVPVDARGDDVDLDLALAGGQGLLAWTAGDGVHVVVLATGGRVGPSHDYGLAGSDTSSPRVAPRAGGYWLAWSATRPDLDASVAAAEGPGERLGAGWAELVPLDSAGVASSPQPLAVTPRDGHASDFDWRPGPDFVDVLVRENVSSGPELGGSIARAGVRAEKIDPPRVIAAGVGRGSPIVVGPWLAYVATLDQPRLLPLDVPGARPSVETAFADARPVWASRAAEGWRVLAVRVGQRERGAGMRSIVCVESR